MSRLVLFTLAVLTVAPLLISALRCRECGTYTCQPTPTNCKYGLVKDVCNCCDVCGKGDGEECGGAWNLRGKCGGGYECVKTNTKPEPDYNAVGVCKTKATPVN